MSNNRLLINQGGLLQSSYFTFLKFPKMHCKFHSILQMCEWHTAFFSKDFKDVWCIKANGLLHPAEDRWMVMLEHCVDEQIAFVQGEERERMVRLCRRIKERASDGWLTFSVEKDKHFWVTSNICYCSQTEKQVTTSI